MLGEEHIKNREKKPRGNLCKKVIFFFLFNILFGGITLPIIVFYGPFDNIRNAVVGSSYRTLNHQYIASFFLSEDEISKILKNSEAKDPTKENESIRLLKFGKDISDRVEVFNIKSRDFNGNIMIIHNPLSIRVGYSSQMPDSGQPTSVIAKNSKALAAINAGGFKDNGYVGTGGVPIGFIIHDGKVVYNEYDNEKIRLDTAAFTDEGMLIVGRHSIEKLKEYNVKEAVSFGPPLIVNGKPTITQGDGGWGIAPRTAIGQRESGEVLFLTIDGRSMGSIGATLKDVQDILLQYGAVNAVNLDGGSSTTAFFNGKVINQPSNRLGERAVPSVFMAVPTGGVDPE